MKRITSLVLILAIYTGLFSPVVLQTRAQETGRGAASDDSDMNSDTPKNGLKFRLSEGAAGAENRAATATATGETLSENQTANLLKRLPEVKADAADKSDFAKRAGSLPPPKTGKTVNVKFPANDGRGTPKVDAGGATLEVLRYSPEGAVNLAPDLSVTFSQPMVVLSSQEEAAQTVPVQFSPALPAGNWRWLGTKTLMFDAKNRFPMATRFSARIPAGTKSANGQILQKDVVWTFQTPPPTVETKIPEGQTTRRDALVFVSFDQAIDADAVLRTTKVSAGGKIILTRLATPDEIAKDASVSYYAKYAQANRWLAFRAVNADGSTENALPANSQITVSVERGAPSAEGNLTTDKAQSFSFRTYGAMRFVKGVCGYDETKRTCQPEESWRLEFTNAIDEKTFDKSLVRVEPNLEGLTVSPGGNTIEIAGYKKGGTTYKVYVDGKLQDAFGQSLGQTAAAIFNVGSSEPSLFAQGGTMVVLDPTAKSAFSIYSTNYNSVHARIYRVEPNDWAQFQDYVRHINYDDSTKKPTIPGKLVADKTVSIKNAPDEMVETRVDLSEYLNDGFGHLIVDIEPPFKRNNYDRTRVFAWVQATQIGLDAFVDNEELVGFATELKTGKPLSGVDLTIYPNGGKNSSINSEQPTENQTASSGQTWWQWLTGFGVSDASINESANENGEDSTTETINTARTNQTGANGILRLALPETQAKEQNILIARRGKDVAFLPENTEYYYEQAGNWFKKNQPDSLRWFVFDDRKMYRPKEEVSVKGYIRVYQGGKLGDIAEVADKASGISYVVRDARGNEIGKGAANLNAFGAFDFKFKLPDNANLGQANVEIKTASSLSGETIYHQFQIQEFRRPEFEVTAKNETEAPFFVKQSVNVSVEAKYFAGGGLANAAANWTVTSTATNYTPPNRSDYSFGTWTPWWKDYGGENYSLRTTQNFKGVTDAAGKHLLKIDFESANPPRPYAVSAAASVQDVNRQTWSSTTNLLVHPSELYVGLKSARTFVNKGEKITVDSIVSDIDGKLIANREVKIKAILKDWTFDKGEWKEEMVDEQTCAVKSVEGDSHCEFTAKGGGTYTISATVYDDRERENESELTVWVAGGKTEPKRTVEQEEAQLIPDKKDYAPGDVAEILVQSPFENAEGVLTLRRDGILKTERFSIKGSSTILRIPLEEKYLPNIYAQVDLTGASARTNDAGEIDAKLAKRPAFATGEINLEISTASRRLTVAAEPQAKTLEPAGETRIDVAVKDSAGNPVANGEVAVVVVDESILALTGYKMANPLDIFYTEREAGVEDYHSRENVILDDPNYIPEGGSTGYGRSGMGGRGIAASDKSVAYAAPMARSSVMLKAENAVDVVAGADQVSSTEAEQNNQPINLRQNFDALAVFAPNVKTDADGRAIVAVKLPDNLTRYRVMAVAVDAGKRFGAGESNITAKQPLMVRPSAPRFMNFGDRIELPVVVQNQTEKDLTVDVAVRATNAELTDGGGRRVTIAANDRAEIRFPVSAMKAGTARFQIAATSGKFADAAEISLPVWTPATTEAFATYGTTDENGAIVQPIQAPQDVFPQFGGLEITTSSTQLQELTDAFIYLQTYPYECSEQVASRMISVAALQDVLRAFKAKEMPSDAELKERFAKDVEILKSRQNDDGYFGLWKRDGERYKFPFVTAHVAHALILAKAKGYDVPDEMVAKTKPYLKNIEKHFDEYHKSPQVRWTISAYALYVRNLMGDRDAAKAKKLLSDATIEKMPFEALGWILSVLADDKNSAVEVENIKRFLMNRTTETAATANFVTDYGDAAWLIMYSNRRADGVLLEALLKADANNDLIPKLVRGLLDQRKAGRWENTQENVFILLALDKYFNAYEKITPDFAARIWLGNTYAGEQIFKGRSVDSNLLNIPMNYLIEQGGISNLIFDKQGAGRLYYRIAMNYAPKNLNLKPADYGFTVLRKYEAVDDADDVKQNADGSWTIKSGARVRVRITMVAPSRRYHVALVDPLPAGLEILNPELAVTEAIPTDKGGNSSVVTYGSQSYGRGFYNSHWTWFEHQNFRDERAEAFSSLLWEGVYKYTYVTRATTPGQFVVPPAKAEEMYHPETFGRTGTDFVKVE